MRARVGGGVARPPRRRGGAVRRRRALAGHPPALRHRARPPWRPARRRGPAGPPAVRRRPAPAPDACRATPHDRHTNVLRALLVGHRRRGPQRHDDRRHEHHAGGVGRAARRVGERVLVGGRCRCGPPIRPTIPSSTSGCSTTRSTASASATAPDGCSTSRGLPGRRDHGGPPWDRRRGPVRAHPTASSTRWLLPTAGRPAHLRHGRMGPATTAWSTRPAACTGSSGCASSTPRCSPGPAGEHAPGRARRGRTRASDLMRA